MSEEARQLEQRLPTDVQCTLCGWWFPFNQTNHYCPRVSGEVVLYQNKGREAWLKGECKP